MTPGTTGAAHFIVPREFEPNPNMSMRFALDAQTLQEGNTSQMIHDVFEFTAYGSNILTLRPGDVIGTTGGSRVGSHAADLPQGR